MITKSIQIKIKTETGEVPLNANLLDSGFDIKSTKYTIVGKKLHDGLLFNNRADELYLSVDYIQYHTGIFIAPPVIQDDKPNGLVTKIYHTLLHPRSSVSKYNLLLCNSVGLIDNEYRGELLIRFKYFWQPEDLIVSNLGGNVVGKVNKEKIYNVGDKIIQILAEETNLITWEVVDELDSTSRMDGGFGSTGK
jgi:dUTPase